MDIGTFIAIFIASLALGVTFWQLWVQRKHNRMSVKPYLVFNRIESVVAHEMAIVLKNAGLGPAIIKDVAVYLNKEPYNMSSTDPWKGLLIQAGLNTGVVAGMTLDKYAISAEETVKIVRAETYNSLKDMIECIHRIDIIIRYESCYGESFEVRLNEDLS